MKRTVIIQFYIESEAGWGQRPDGASLHLTLADCAAYTKKAWETQDAYFKKAGVQGVPSEYTRPGGDPRPIDVGEAVYKKLVANKKKRGNGIPITDAEADKLTK